MSERIPLGDRIPGFRLISAENRSQVAYWTTVAGLGFAGSQVNNVFFPSEAAKQKAITIQLSQIQHYQLTASRDARELRRIQYGLTDRHIPVPHQVTVDLSKDAHLISMAQTQATALQREYPNTVPNAVYELGLPALGAITLIGTVLWRNHREVRKARKRDRQEAPPPEEERPQE